MIIRNLYAFLVLILLCNSPAAADANQEITILYFFSSKCPHCREVAPLVRELSKTYKVLGYYPGKEEKPDVPFPVDPGRRDLQTKYEVPGVPSMVVLQKGEVKQKLIGSVNIQFAPVLLKAYGRGALSVSEALKRPPGNIITFAGIIRKGGAVRGANKEVYYLTDGVTKLPVRPWLSAETVKNGSGKDQARQMSDVAGKAVVLKGHTIRTAGSLKFIVQEEVSGE